MEDLIKALQILSKYTETKYPTNCSHDVLFVNVDPELVSKEDIETLDALGFFVSEEDEGFSSFRFGSC